jgi:hypothetical protein
VHEQDQLVEQALAQQPADRGGGTRHRDVAAV